MEDGVAHRDGGAPGWCLGLGRSAGPQAFGRRAFWICLCLRRSGLQFGGEKVWCADISLGVGSVDMVGKALGLQEIKEGGGRGRQEEIRKRRRKEGGKEK